MAEPTITSVNNSVLLLKQRVTNLENDLKALDAGLAIYVSRSDLQTYITDLQSNINDLNTAIATIENKLAKVVLPNDTRYYLEQSEITDFRNHFRQLRAMMSALEKSRQSFVRLASRYQMTNSQL